MEPTRNLFRHTVTAKDGREVVVPRAYNGKDFLQEWVEENEAEAAELRRREAEMNEKVTPAKEE